MPEVLDHPMPPPAPREGAAAVSLPAAAAPAPGERGDGHPRRGATDAGVQVRAADLEPYIGLKYLSRLFKLMAVVLILLLVSEVVTGLVTNGVDALLPLLAEVSRLIVFAGLLWGTGDLAILLIDIGHDLRATRILIGRQLAHHTAAHPDDVDPGLPRRDVVPAATAV